MSAPRAADAHPHYQTAGGGAWLVACAAAAGLAVAASCALIAGALRARGVSSERSKPRAGGGRSRRRSIAPSAGLANPIKLQQRKTVTPNFGVCVFFE